MAAPLKDYLVRLDDLTPFVGRTTREIRDLDEKVEQLCGEIKGRIEFHMNNLDVLTKEERERLHHETQAMFKEVDKLSEKKLRLARKLYDLVDDHIKEMDQKIADFLEYQRRKSIESGETNSGNTQENSSLSESAKKKRSPLKAKHVNDSTADSLDSTLADFDMPIDPNEPTYCICHQVSYGQMVACDGPNCKNEWFHFQCVGLTSSPVGKWYCDDCKEARKKRHKH